MDQISRPLVKIFKKSLETGEVPIPWKSAHVTPIFKSGDKHSASNYRPVSLTSMIREMHYNKVKDKLMLHT